MLRGLAAVVRDQALKAGDALQSFSPVSHSDMPRICGGCQNSWKASAKIWSLRYAMHTSTRQIAACCFLATSGSFSKSHIPVLGLQRQQVSQDKHAKTEHSLGWADAIETCLDLSKSFIVIYNWVMSKNSHMCRFVKCATWNVEKSKGLEPVFGLN